MATRTCADTSYAEVNNCVNGVAGGTNQFNTIAPDGTLVVVPAGTSTWSSTLNITKRIVLQGATTITGTTAPHTSDGSGRLTTNDQAIILDGCLNNSGSRQMITATFDDGDTIDGFHPRITGLTLRGASSTGEASGATSYGAYAIVLQGTNQNTRLDNIHFDHLHHYSYLKQGSIHGVNDHCVHDQFYGKDVNGKNVQTGEIVEIYDDSYGATALPAGYGFSGLTSVATSYGNQSWVDSPNLASNQDKFWYIEDCQHNNNYDGTAGAYNGNGGAIDATFGARFVVRYCLFNQGGFPAVHGTESGGQRGARLMLVYRNSLQFNAAIGASNVGSLVRSGSQIWFDNDFHLPPGNTGGPCGLSAARQTMSSNMGVADATNPWDLVNTDGGSGIGIGSNGAHIFRSSTATATTPIATTVAAGSNGVNINTFAGAGVLNVASTTGFLSSGTQSLTVSIANVGPKTVTYTGITSTTFTGCTSAQSGVMTTGAAVSQGQTNTLIDTQSPSLTTDQWKGYQLRDDAVGADPKKLSSFITAINASTSKITVAASTGGQTMAFVTGDAYTIRQNLVTIDQAARGSGDLCSGVNGSATTVSASTVLNVTAGNIKSWPHQKLEPCYSVGNTLNASGTAYDSTKLFSGFFHQSAGTPTFAADRDWYNETTSFNGTSGVGRGVLASRPGTGTNGTDIASGYYTLGYNPPGTAYFATDQGSWNGSGDGRGSGKLQAYVNGAWTDYFVPYTYPHPLVQTPAGKIISLSGNMTFGNVITNTTAQSTLSIFNTGDTTLTVTSIAYPTGYTGAYSGTIAAGASHDVTVAFAPTLVQTYNGTITVNSDATSGTNTMAATGAGTSPPITNTPNPGREKSAARRITGIGRRM